MGIFIFFVLLGLFFWIIVTLSTINDNTKRIYSEVEAISEQIERIESEQVEMRRRIGQITSEGRFTHRRDE